MADAGGGAPSAGLAGSHDRPPSASSSSASTASAGSAQPPLDGGAFLLQLLQKPPQAQPSLPQEASCRGHGHHHDPAVATLGPSHPFLPRDFVPPPPPPGHSPDPLLFPFSVPPAFPPGLWPPPLSSSLGFPPLLGADPGGSHGPGQRPYFRMDGQRLGLSPGAVGPLPPAPLKGDLGRTPGYPHRDRAPAKNSGARGQEERTSLRTPPGFPKLPGDGAAELERGSASQSISDGGSKQWKAHAERPRRPVEQNHFHGDRGRSAAFQRSGMAGEQGRPSGPAQRPPGAGQWVATSQRRDGNHSLGRGKWSQNEENHQPHPPLEDVLRRGLMGDLEQKHGAAFHKLEIRRQPFSCDLHIADNRDFVGKIDVGAAEGDSDDEVDISGGQRLETADQNEIGDFPPRWDTTREEDLLSEELMDSLTLKVDTVQKNLTTHLSTSRGKDFRSDFSRGHHVSSQRMRIQRRGMACRRDIDALTPSFLSIFDALVPAEEEKAKQQQLLLSLGKLINREWPNAQLYLYGSCANSFGVKNSDIDVCLAIDDKEMSKLDILLKLADILQSGNLQNVQALTRARVPIVKLMDPVTGLSCDICINNLLAVVNTKLLKDYAQIDERLRQLVFIVKHWARSRRVNETYQGTLSSYAYVLMCIHFLQLRRPAILPCLQVLEATYIVTVDNTECAYFDQVANLHGFGARNKESIARLLWAFFHYWAYHHDYTNDVISIRTGSIISKRAKDWTRRIGNDRHLICIEDPFEISHDLGRVVDKYSIKILREEFERAANILQYDPNPSVTLFEAYVPASLQS